MASAFAELDAIDSEREQASRFADLDAIDAERAKPQAFADLDAIDAERAKPSSGLLAQAGAGIAQHLGDVLKGQANPTAIDFANPLTQPLALVAQIPGVKRVMERAGEALTDRANAVPAPQGVLQGGARMGGGMLIPIASMGATMAPAMSGEALREAQQEGASPAQTTLRQVSGQVVGGALALVPNAGNFVRSVGPAARTALNIGGQAAAGAAGEVALNAVAGRPLLENVEDATTQQAIFSAGLEALGAGLRGVRGLRMPQQQQPAQPIQGNGARAAGPETAGTGSTEIPVRPDPAPELSSAPPEPVRPGQESPVETTDAVPPPRPQSVEAAGPTTPPEAANDTRPAAAEDLRSLGPALGARVVETQKPVEVVKPETFEQITNDGIDIIAKQIDNKEPIQLGNHVAFVTKSTKPGRAFQITYLDAAMQPLGDEPVASLREAAERIYSQKPLFHRPDVPDTAGFDERFNPTTTGTQRPAEIQPLETSSGTITGSNVEQAAEMPVRAEGAARAPEPQKPSSPPSTQPEATAYKPPRIARADQPVVDAVLDPQSRALVKDLSKLPGRTLNYLARELGLEAKARNRKALVAEIHAAQPVATAGRYVMARTDMDGIVQKHGLRGPLEDLQKEVASIASAIRRNALEFGKTPRKVGDRNSAGQYDEVIWENRGRVYPPGMNKDTVPALQRFLAGEPMSGKQLAHVQRAINHLTRDWPKEAWEGVTRPEEFPAPRATEEVFREYAAEGRVLPHDADVWLDLNAKTEAINSRGESIDVPVNDSTYRIVTHIPVRDEAGNVTGFDYLVTDDNKTFLRVGEDAILKGEADETTSKTFFDQFTKPQRSSEADAGAPAAVQRPAGEVPQSGSPGERSLRPGDRGDEPETLTRIENVPESRQAETLVSAERAKYARDLRNNSTGWKIVDHSAGATLVSPDGKKIVRFVSSDPRSGAEILRKRVEAQAWAIDNPLVSQPLPAGEFVSQVLGSQPETLTLQSETRDQRAAREKAAADKAEIARRQNERKTGNAGDLGTGEMFDKTAGENALFTQQNALSDALENLKAGDVFTDGQGQQWRIAKHRHGKIEAHPIVDGRPQVNRDSMEEFATTEMRKLRDPDLRTDVFPETGPQRPADFQQVETAKPSVPELRDAAQKKADVAELYSGIPFLNAVPRRARALAANDLPEQPGPLQSNDPAVERRWQAAKLKPTPLRDKLTNAARAVKNSFTRHFPELDRVRHAPEIEILRQHEAAPQLAQMKAAEEIHAIAGNLGPKKFGVFERLVILPDLLRDIDRGLHEGKELPFGYASRNAVAADLHKFEQIAARNPDLKRAVEQRRVMMNAVRDEMVSRDLLPEGVKDFDDYFHRQVMVHRAMQEASGPGTSAGEVRNQTKGFQRARTGSSKDYNTSYLESEFEVLSQMYAQMATQDTLGRLNRTSNIAPQLREAARAQGVEDWRTLVPEGYTLWQPERGNHFHWGNTLTDRVVEQFLRGEKMLEEGDFKKALVMGQAKDQWAIPKELAKTLDNFGPRPDTLVEKFVAAGIGSWKVWTLLNPLRAAGYNLSNAVGDSDVVMAYDPKIFTYAPQAVRDLKKWVINKDKATPEIEDAVRRGNLSSSFTVAELPDVSQSVLFALLKGEKPGLVKQYWSSVKDYTRWREEVLRLAALRYFKDEQRAGRIRYGASERADVDALRATMPDEVPYKLARELIGDYGNVSQAGQWLRSHLIPFYSWMEINAPRYVRMFKNLPGEGRGTGDVVKVLGAKTAGKAALYTARAAGLYMMLNLWNKTMFPEEERELDIGGRRQLHLILGRREDGTIRTIRMAGALSDALGWFGAEDFPSDVSDVAEGRASVGDKIIEAAKAPVNRVINASSPIKKTVAESLMGATMYPDAFNPRPIRDKAEHIAGLMSAKPIYRYLADRPGPKTDGADKLLSLVTYTTDPGEAAYNVARTIAQEWLEKNARESNPGEPTARQNALYYYKQAVKYKDDRLAQKYWADYVRLGGNTKAAGQSIARAAPAASVPAAYRGAFMQSLTPREREIMSTAEAWYRKTYRP